MHAELDEIIPEPAKHAAADLPGGIERRDQIGKDALEISRGEDCASKNSIFEAILSIEPCWRSLGDTTRALRNPDKTGTNQLACYANATTRSYHPSTSLCRLRQKSKRS